jgi:hypothetical protein
MIGQFVAAALQEPVELERYSSKKVPYVSKVIDKAIKEATQTAVSKVIAEEAPAIEAQVSEALKAQIPDLSASLVKSAQEAASSSYRVQVQINHAGYSAD